MCESIQKTKVELALISLVMSIVSIPLIGFAVKVYGMFHPSIFQHPFSLMIDTLGYNLTYIFALAAGPWNINLCIGILVAVIYIRRKNRTSWQESD